MTTVHLDTFTGTNGTALVDHTPDTGDGYEDLAYNVNGTEPGSPVQTQIVNNRCAGDGANNSNQVMARATTDPGADEYDVEVFHGHNTGQATRQAGVEVRVSPTGTSNSAVDRYGVLLNGTADPGTIVLYKVVSGSRTELDSASYSVADHDILIEVRAGGITVYVDTVATLTTDDTAITQRGRITVGMTRSGDFSASTNWLDDLEIVSVAAAPDHDETLTDDVAIDDAGVTVESVGAYEATISDTVEIVDDADEVNVAVEIESELDPDSVDIEDAGLSVETQGGTAYEATLPADSVGIDDGGLDIEQVIAHEVTLTDTVGITDTALVAQPSQETGDTDDTSLAGPGQMLVTGG